MKNNKNLHLILSVIIIIPIGLAYGLCPEKILPKLFGFTVTGTDLVNIFRAIMGLYLAIAAFWIMGILKPSLWYAATISNIIFMGGLASGRLLSMIVDGIPSVYFSAGFVLETVLAVWAIKNIRSYVNSREQY